MGLLVGTHEERSKQSNPMSEYPIKVWKALIIIKLAISFIVLAFSITELNLFTNTSIIDYTGKKEFILLLNSLAVYSFVMMIDANIIISTAKASSRVESHHGIIYRCLMLLFWIQSRRRILIIVHIANILLFIVTSILLFNTFLG